MASCTGTSSRTSEWPRLSGGGAQSSLGAGPLSGSGAAQEPHHLDSAGIMGPLLVESRDLGNVEHLVCTEESRYLIGACCVQGKDSALIEVLARQSEGAQTGQGKEPCTHRAAATQGK